MTEVGTGLSQQGLTDGEEADLAVRHAAIREQALALQQRAELLADEGGPHKDVADRLGQAASAIGALFTPVERLDAFAGTTTIQLPARFVQRPRLDLLEKNLIRAISSLSRDEWNQLAQTTAWLVDWISRETTRSYREWSYTGGLEGLIEERLGRLRMEVSAIQQDLANETVRSVSQIALKVGQDAGRAGTDTLATHFQTFGDEQNRRSWGWLIGALVAVVGAVLGAFSVTWNNAQSLTLLTTIHQALIVVPLFALGAYAARESSRYRALAQWASRLNAQLLSLDLYVERLDAEGQQQIWRDFSAVVFASHVPGKENELQPLSPSGMANLSETVVAALKRAN